VFIATGGVRCIPLVPLAVASALVFTLPLVFFDRDSTLWLRTSLDLSRYLAGVPMAWAASTLLGVLGIGGLFLVRRDARWLPLGLLLLGSMGLVAIPRPGMVSIWATCHSQFDELGAVLEIASLIPPDARSSTMLWYDDHALLQIEGCPDRGLRITGIAAAQATSMYNTAGIAPSTSDIPERFFNPSTRIGTTWVILGTVPTIDASVASLMARVPMRIEVVRTVVTPTLQFDIRIMRVSPN